MQIVSVVRSIGWLCCLSSVLLAGCARFGWSNASRDRRSMDDDASFISSTQNKPPATLKPATPPATNLPPIVNAAPAAPAITQPPALAAQQPPASPTAKPDAKPTTSDTASTDRVALEADLRKRMQSLPDVTPEEMQEFERSMVEAQGPFAMQQLRQLSAIVRMRQRQADALAKPQNTAAIPTVPPPTYPTTKASALLPVVEAKSVEPKEPVAAAATEPKEPVVETPAESPVSESASPGAPRSVADRLRQAKERSSTPQRSGIFDGKVKTSATNSAADVAGQLALHTSRKPTEEVEEVQDAEAASDADEASPGEPAEASAEEHTEDTTPPELSWREHLAAAIVDLEAELRGTELSPEQRVQHETQLRLMHLLSSQTDAALREIPGLEADQQDYWRCQLHSLQVSMATDGTPVKGRRATLALRPLREAVDHLASQATLDVRNVVLCKEVTIWGNYREFEKYEFKPDQEVLLYFEVENFAVVESPQGYATEFVSSYEMFDTAGRRVAEQQLPVAQEVCKNRRRDYFVRYHLHIPKQLAAGEYTLQLTVEDQKGHKFGQGSVKFKVI